MQKEGIFIGKDIPFKLIDGEFCRVITCVPFADIDEKGAVHSISLTTPYAFLHIESPALPKEKDCYLPVTNKMDFKHLCEALKAQDPSIMEVIIVYEVNPYKYQRNIWLKLFKKVFPHLHIFLYQKGGLEKLYDRYDSHTPSSGEAGFQEVSKIKIKEWGPIKGLSEMD